MKEISVQQYDLIIDSIASSEHLYLSPAGLEKDFLLTDTLRTLCNFDDPTFTITFGGGTSLIKNYGIITRLSEDLDFKISLKDFKKPDLPKSDLKRFFRRLESRVQESGFEYKIERISDEYNSFCFLLYYKSKFPRVVTLRDEIRLEFTSSLVSPAPKPLPTHSVLYRDLAIPEDCSELYCVSLEQTLAEKVVAILTKIEFIENGDDDRLVRHISDIHEIYLRGYDRNHFINSFLNAVEEDRQRFGNKSIDLRAPDIRSERLARLWNIKGIEDKYSDFVVQFSSAKNSNFLQARETLETLCQKDFR